MTRKISKRTGSKSYKKEPSLFFRSWWSFTKRQEMIGPYISYFEQSRLERYVQSEINLQRDLDYVSTLPDHLIGDIYNLYYTPSRDQEYAPIDKSNKGKWDLLQHINDSSLKVITNGNSYVSRLFTTEICIALLKVINQEGGQFADSLMDDLNNVSYNDVESDNNSDSDNSQDKESEDNDENDQSNNDNQSNQPDNQSSNQSDKDSSNSSSQDSSNSSSNPSNESSAGQGSSKTEFEERVDDISDDLETKLNEAKSKVLKRLSKLASIGIDASRLTDEAGYEIDKLINEGINLTIASESIKPIVNKIVDTSRSYFSSNSTNRNISIFESDNLDGLDGLENMIGRLRKLSFDEVTTREKKYKGKLNVYIDISTSMNGGMYINDTHLSRLLFAKSITKKLYELGVINELFTFNDDIQFIAENPTLIDIIPIHTSGGTYIDNVMNHIIEKDTNAIIVTDCEDCINVYSEKAFVLGVPGARLDLANAATNFKGAGQVWVFEDDQTIKSL